jgi:hypothetical protein
MEKVIWFSRNEMTPKQRDEIVSKHGDDVEILNCSRTASVDLIDEGDVNAVWNRLQVVIGNNFHEMSAVYGVFPAPIQERITEHFEKIRGTPCYSAWNVQRSVEGEKPTFEHKRFCFVGYM